MKEYKYKEVIRFACGIPAASVHMTQFVYDLFVDSSLDCECDPIQFTSPDDSEEFLNSLLAEACDEGIVDPFHNRYINIIQGGSIDESSGDSKDDSDRKGKRERLFIPSLHFIFPDVRATCKSTLFTIDQSLLFKRVQAECILFATGNDELYDKLRVLQRVSKYQDISVKTFIIRDIYTITDDPVSDQGTVDPTSLLLEMIEARVDGSNEDDDSSVVQFLELCLAIMSSESDPTETTEILNHMVANVDENIAKDPTVQVMKDVIRPKLNSINKVEIPDSVKAFCKLFIETVIMSRFVTYVHVVDCMLPSQVTKHLIDQLRGCNDLRELVLYQLEFPDNLGDTMASMSSLEAVRFSGTLEKDNRLLAGLSHSHMLKILVINGCKLSDQVSYLFGDQGHPGFRQLVELSLVDTKLRKVDLESISSAVTNGKLPLLHHLNLSENTLTDCLSDLFGSSDCPGFSLLETLQLENTKLSKEDLIAVFEALRQDKLPILRNIKVLPLNLTDYLDDSLIAAHHPLFPYRKSMILKNCNLSVNTIRNICTSVRDGKLSNLKEVDLSENVLTNCLSGLFGSFDSPEFPWLRRLCLNNCCLGEVDLVSIFNAGIKLVELEELDLSNNSLKNLFQSFLGGANHPGFPSLQSLRLKSCQLSATDLVILGDSIHTGKLPTLCELDLSNNILTNWLRCLLGIESKTDLLSLCQLMLDNTHLHKDDVKSISTALTFIKLPKLKLLSLKGNSLCSAEEEAKMLIHSFLEFSINVYGQSMSLDLRGNNFSEEFTEGVDHFHSDPKVLIKD